MDVEKMARRWANENELTEEEADVACAFFMVGLSRMRCERCKGQKTCVFYKAVMSIHGIGKSFNLFGCIHFEEKED